MNLSVFVIFLQQSNLFLLLLKGSCRIEKESERCMQCSNSPKSSKKDGWSNKKKLLYYLGNQGPDLNIATGQPSDSQQGPMP